LGGLNVPAESEHILTVILRAALLRGVSKDNRGYCRLWPSFEARRCADERLRMTIEIFRSSTLNFFIPYPRP
jgi:hypothetical protein